MTRFSMRPFCGTDTDWLTNQHQKHYSDLDGFDDTFGPLVRSILTDFTQKHDPSCEAGWIAMLDGAPVGSIFCVRHSDTLAKLRLFFLLPAARGQGIGAKLLNTCMQFAHMSGYAGMTLWTHESHRAACALYQKFGWTLAASKPVHSFGQPLVEQTWTITFDKVTP